jgi:DNA-binding transcriptional MerR regulator
MNDRLWTENEIMDMTGMTDTELEDISNVISPTTVLNGIRYYDNDSLISLVMEETYKKCGFTSDEISTLLSRPHKDNVSLIEKRLETLEAEDQDEHLISLCKTLVYMDPALLEVSDISSFELPSFWHSLIYDSEKDFVDHIPWEYEGCDIGEAYENEKPGIEYEKAMKQAGLIDQFYFFAWEKFYDREWDSRFAEYSYLLAKVFWDGKGCKTDKRRALDHMTMADYYIRKKVDQYHLPEDIELQYCIAEDLYALRNELNIDCSVKTKVDDYPIMFNYLGTAFYPYNLRIQSNGDTSELTMFNSSPDYIEAIQMPEYGYIEFLKEIRLTAENVREIYPRNGIISFTDYDQPGLNEDGTVRFFNGDDVVGWIRADRYVFKLRD